MEVRHLGDMDFGTIMECFLVSFENYFVQMPTDHAYYKQRWKAAGVQYELSFGMFDGERLVGFILNAIDRRQDQLRNMGLAPAAALARLDTPPSGYGGSRGGDA